MIEKSKYSICLDKNDVVVFSTTNYKDFMEYLYSSEYDKIDEPSWIYANLTDQEFEQMFPAMEGDDENKTF